MGAVVRGYVVRGSKIVMYAFGTRRRHGQAAAGRADGAGGEIRRMTLRVDGWSSLGTDTAKWSGGTAATVPLKVPAGTNCLRVNAVTGVGGRLVIGLSNIAGQDLPGTPIRTQPADVCYSRNDDRVHRSWSELFHSTCGRLDQPHHGMAVGKERHPSFGWPDGGDAHAAQRCAVLLVCFFTLHGRRILKCSAK